MRLAISLVPNVALVLIAHGCGSAPSIRPACRDAGFDAAQVEILIPPIQNALEAGTSREEVLDDARVACASCADPDQACDEELCFQCFTTLVDEIYGEPEGQTNP